MVNIIYAAIILFCLGVYMILISKIQYASLTTKKLITTIYGKDKKSFNINIIFNDIASRLSKYIKMDAYKKRKIQNTLKIAGINSTPEIFIATVWIKTLIPIICGVIISSIFPILLPVFLVIAIRTYFKESKIIDKELMKERIKLENELPRFVREIAQEMKSSKDVYSMLKRYETTAGGALKKELNITLADMKSGNYETALTRFETRIGSPMLSEVIRGLISVVRGDDTIVYFQMLAHDFKQLEIQKLKYIANKRPDKLKKYTFYMLGCMTLLYVVIMTMAILNGLGGFK